MDSTDSDPVERIMTACFERPQAEWPAAFDAACREHPEHACFYSPETLVNRPDCHGYEVSDMLASDAGSALVNTPTRRVIRSSSGA